MSLLARSAALLPLVTALLLSSSRAEAQPNVLLMPGNPDAQSEGLADVIRAAGFTPIVAESLESSLANAAKTEGNREQQALSALGVGLDAAKAKYLSQEFTAMVSDLVSLREQTLWLTSRSSNRKLLWELCFQLGLAHHARGKADDASREFALANAIEPERRPARDIYGPDVGQAYAAAVAANSGVASRPFRVDASPADAAVVIDGVALVGSKGRAVTPGLHVVRVTAPGYEPAALVVDSSVDSTKTIELKAVDGDAATRAGAAWSRGELRAGTATSNELLSAIAADHDAQTLVWVGSGSPVDVIALDAVGQTATESAATARAALEALLGRLDQRGRVAERDVLGGAGKPSGSNRNKWLIAGGVGVAVVAIVVTSIVLSSGGDGGGDADRIQIGIVP